MSGLNNNLSISDSFCVDTNESRVCFLVRPITSESQINSTTTFTTNSQITSPSDSSIQNTSFLAKSSLNGPLGPCYNELGQRVECAQCIIS